MTKKHLPFLCKLLKNTCFLIKELTILLRGAIIKHTLPKREVFGKERIKMKRFLALFLTIVMLLAMFASCQPKVPQETTPEGSTPEGPTPEATTPEETTPDEGGQIVPPMPNWAEHIIPPLNPTQLFNTNDGCKEAIFENATSIDKIIAAFKNEGYTQLTADMVEGAKLQTVLLNKADELVTVYWIPAEKEARVIWEKIDVAALAPLQKTEITGGGTLTMVQIGVERVSETDNPNIGR